VLARYALIWINASATFCDQRHRRVRCHAEGRKRSRAKRLRGDVFKDVIETWLNCKRDKEIREEEIGAIRQRMADS
jgi:hypothetical protein